MDDLGHNISPKTPKPHDVLWLPDGNVILATDSFLFKVHKSVLSMQSSVFKDMFALSTVDGTQTIVDSAGIIPELYEGLPLVNLVGDKGADVAHLLQAAYERQYYRRDKDDTPLDIITALLVLSTKYDFKHIRTDVIVQISKHYPMTLAAYDAIDNDVSPLFGETREDCHYPLLGAIFTAKVDALLPILYYACADYTIDNIFIGADMLVSECLHTSIAGKVKLEHAICKLVADIPDELHVRGIVCPANTTCPVHAQITGLAGRLCYSDLKEYEGHKLVEDCLQNACTRCAKILGDRINVKRQEIWDNVPSYFGLPGWDQHRQKLAENC